MNELIKIYYNHFYSRMSGQQSHFGIKLESRPETQMRDWSWKISKILMNWNSFVGINGLKFFIATAYI